MNILAIDIGTTTGWAMRTTAGAVSGGSQSFALKAMDGPGQRWIKFRYWLAETQKQAGSLDIVYYELVRNHTATQAAHIYGGFEAMLQAYCEANRILLVGVAVGTIKKFWTGNGNADKAAMIAEAKQRGFKPVDDNHADALALLAYANKQESGGV